MTSPSRAIPLLALVAALAASACSSSADDGSGAGGDGPAPQLVDTATGGGGSSTPTAVPAPQAGSSASDGDASSAGNGPAGASAGAGAGGGEPAEPASGGSAAGDPAMDPPSNANAGAGGAAVTDEGPVAIDPPVADDCITDVSAGDHTFVCQGVTFDVMVDPHCTQYACGLIFEVHGASMSGPIMRANTHLHELGAEAGYLVVHPTSPTGTWDWATHPPILVDFMQRMIDAFHVDTRRVHMTGFSMGSAMTFWFLCNYRDVLASVGPVTGSSADQVMDEATGENCIASIDETWTPRVPILFMSGTLDNALTADAASARTEGIVSRLGLTGGEEIDGEATWRRRRWQGDDGMVFDFLTHDYSSLILAGHCIPGGPAGDLFACTGATLDWGHTVLEWFIEHPKPR